MGDVVFRSSAVQRMPSAARRRQARFLTVALLLVAACSRQSDVSFFVLVKSSNYAQSSDGSLTLLNFHFFSEIFLQPNGSVTSASVERAASPDAAMEYVDQGDNYYMEGGHFDSRAEVDEAHPNGLYVFTLESPSVQIRGLELRLEGPAGASDIPEPVTISLWQGGSRVSPLGLDADQDLIVRWSAYSNGSEDPRGIVDDMIFVVVADCRGERVFHTGLPFQGDYLTFRASEVLVERGTLRAGEPYSAFVEFPHVSDSRVEKGVPGFTSYATATYLDLHTTGRASDRSCPDVRPPMDTGQTGPVEVEGNVPTLEVPVDPGRPGGVLGVARARFRFTLFHEVHHLVRGWTMQDGTAGGRMLDDAVSEGMATAFERDAAGSQPPWGDYPDEDVEAWVEELLAVTGLEGYPTWMFQHPDGRRWIGYRAGTYLTDRAMSTCGCSAADLVSMPTDEVLVLARSPEAPATRESPPQSLG